MMNKQILKVTKKVKTYRTVINLQIRRKEILLEKLHIEILLIIIKDILYWKEKGIKNSSIKI